MSRVFGVSRSGYYRWLTRPPSKRSLYNNRLRTLISECWLASRQIYGSPRIHRALTGQGWQASRPRVARLMKGMGIASRIRPKWIQTTDGHHSWPVADNLLDRNFRPAQLGQVWVSDITYVLSEQGWLYLTTVMDLADRQIIGWSLSDTISAEATSIGALQCALQKRPARPGLMFHSDRGVQYACGEFTRLLAAREIVQSMSRKGNCWDNAPAESFFKTLKHEMDMPKAFSGQSHARAELFDFIEIWYNRRRLHSALDYKTPVQVEYELTRKQAA